MIAAAFDTRTALVARARKRAKKRNANRAAWAATVHERCAAWRSRKALRQALDNPTPTNARK